MALVAARMVLCGNTCGICSKTYAFPARHAKGVVSAAPFCKTRVCPSPLPAAGEGPPAAPALAVARLLEAGIGRPRRDSYIIV